MEDGNSVSQGIKDLLSLAEILGSGGTSQLKLLKGFEETLQLRVRWA